MYSTITTNNNHNTPKIQRDFIHTYFFQPNFAQKILALLLLPFSLLYYCIAIGRKNLSKKKYFFTHNNHEAKIISIGNLVSGGSGKTPFCIALVQYLESQGYNNIFVILRGYKRHSKGLKEVSLYAQILCNVQESGDEAMLIAQKIQGSVLVSENREIAIKYALEKNAQIIILDDAYRFNFQKFDILLEPETLPYFSLVLPSGYYRFPPSFYTKCNLHVKENKDYKRQVKIILPQQVDSITKYRESNIQTQDSNAIKNISSNTQAFHSQTANMLSNNTNNTNNQAQDSQTANIASNIQSQDSLQKSYVLATAIANPTRLIPYLPENLKATYCLPDHAEFTQETLQNLLHEYHATHILMTQKDYVKCKNFTLPFAILDLEIKINDNILDRIQQYLNS